QDVGQRLRQRRVESTCFGLDLLGPATVVVLVSDLEIAHQQLDHRQPGRRPCETEHASSTLHPSGIVALNSYIRRDLPAPASPTAAAICPRPALVCSSAAAIAAISRSRPTNRVSPRRAASWKCVRSAPARTTS